MYRTYSVRYLQLFCAICDFLILWKVHYFGKRWFFHEIFQVGACPNLIDSSLYEMNSIHMYKARSIWYLQQFLSICDSLMPSMVHFLGKKKMIFHELFQVCACPNLKNSLLYDRFSIHMYKARSIGYLQHAPTWKIPYYMTGFLFICPRQEAFGIFNNFPLSASLLCLVRYIFWKKMIFHEIFQVGAGPNLKDSLLYDRFSIHMYKA